MSSGTSAAATTNGKQRDNIAGKEYKKLGFSLFVWISDGKLECRCSYVPRSMGAMMTRDELLGYLAESGVKEGLDDDAINGFAIKAAAGKELGMELLASGVPPVAGADGWISYSVQSSIIIQDEIDDGTIIDMHNVQSFMNVVPGDEIGRIIPPEPGSAGRSVTGQTIPPQPGKSLNLKIGKNIRYDGDGGPLIAEAAGRVCLASGEISVEEEYVVAGDVDFRVGSIVFNGFVGVRGDVLNDFNINATKGMRIGGNIGACAIRSDGDIAFCGMDGQERGTVVCGGSIRANFLHDCHVTCAGDVIVEVELHNCTIRTLGRIVVNKGTISGGSYTALGGIEARKVGSPASTRTRLTAGVDYRDAEELVRLLAELDRNQTQIGLTQSMQEIEELRKVRAGLTDSIHALRSKADPRANPKINVKAVLYDNILISLGTLNEEIKEQKDGPLSILENTIEGGLRFLSLTSLDVRASDIDLAFIREQKR
ncbi:MAG: DUF342 domain-containing protein [Deltaproteobacteria bacterium]|nr:DUF342 domain-containing protein [Deltaproteobacteria bacterium]